MKTIVLLDVDGVLLPMGGELSKEEGVPVGPVFVRRAVQDWLKKLSAQAEIYWATSWQASAQIFNEALGFDCQGFLDFTGPRRKNYLWNKLEVLEDFCQRHPGRKFVLIDDNANKWLIHPSSALTELEKSGQMLIIRPFAYTGISDREMKKVLRFVEKV